MASKRHMRRKACEWKLAYPTQTEAVAASIRLRKRTGSVTGAYRCPFCGQWHHGHTASRTREALRARRG